jgi:hypothetical protein
VNNCHPGGDGGALSLSDNHQRASDACTCGVSVSAKIVTKLRQPSCVSGITVHYSRGLPVVTVPLPSRKERCRFTLRPISHSVGDFQEMLRNEDKGIDRVAVTTLGECAH